MHISTHHQFSLRCIQIQIRTKEPSISRNFSDANSDKLYLIDEESKYSNHKSHDQGQTLRDWFSELKLSTQSRRRHLSPSATPTQISRRSSQSSIRQFSRPSSAISRPQSAWSAPSRPTSATSYPSSRRVPVAPSRPVSARPRIQRKPSRTPDSNRTPSRPTSARRASIPSHRRPRSQTATARILGGSDNNGPTRISRGSFSSATDSGVAATRETSEEESPKTMLRPHDWFDASSQTHFPDRSDNDDVARDEIYQGGSCSVSLQRTLEQIFEKK